MARFVQKREFTKILESEMDINLKIAKLISNELNWKLEFNTVKGCKYSILLPLHGGGDMMDHPQEMIEREEKKTMYDTSAAAYETKHTFDLSSSNNAQGPSTLSVMPMSTRYESNLALPVEDEDHSYGLTCIMESYPLR